MKMMDEIIINPGEKIELIVVPAEEGEEFNKLFYEDSNGELVELKLSEKGKEAVRLLNQKKWWQFWKK